jgi:hypothetical protein
MATSSWAAAGRAVLSSGTTECWGNDEAGQLGTNASVGKCSPSGYVSSIPCSTTPVKAIGLTTATGVSAGPCGTCGVVAGRQGPAGMPTGLDSWETGRPKDPKNVANQQIGLPVASCQ